MSTPASVAEIEARVTACRTAGQLLDEASRVAEGVRGGAIPPVIGAIWVGMLGHALTRPGLLANLGSYRDGYPECPPWMLDIVHHAGAVMAQELAAAVEESK